jgi:mRNA interferase MazF
MDKEFDKWNDIKKETNSQNEYLLYYHERQIRWCKLGVNVGFEQDGTGKEYSRPVLVIKAFSRQVCLVIPLTTSQKNNKYHIPIGDIGNKKAFAIISQIPLIDTKRLDKHVATLNKALFEQIRKAIKNLL